MKHPCTKPDTPGDQDPLWPTVTAARRYTQSSPLPAVATLVLLVLSLTGICRLEPHVCFLPIALYAFCRFVIDLARRDRDSFRAE